MARETSLPVSSSSLRRQVRALWVAWALLASAVGFEGFLLWKQPATVTSGPAPTLSTGQEIRPPYSKEVMEAARAGQLVWLEEFFKENQVGETMAGETRGILTEYMKRVNMIAVMEAEGVHEAADAQKFREVEYERLDKALKVALGENFTNKIRGPLGANGILPR